MPRELGEFELIDAIRARVESAGAPRATSRLAVSSGDDAAVSRCDGAAVTSVDAFVEGVHFERDLFPLRAIGHKALAAALSDLAAMGAEPGEAYVQLMIPDDLASQDCLELADGLAGVAASAGVAIAGGDVSRAGALTLALTVVGYVASAGDAVLRSGGAPGDVVAVTGELGGAAAGLEVLTNPAYRERLDRDLADRLVRRQLEPRPRLEAGRALAAAGATAMIDLSDGLGADAGHVAAASGVAIAVDLSSLPVQDGVSELAAIAGLDPIDLAAGAGEDYELLAALPPGRLARASAALEELGVPLTELGAVREGAGVELIDPDGAARPPGGYDQLARRQAPSAPS